MQTVVRQVALLRVVVETEELALRVIIFLALTVLQQAVGVVHLHLQKEEMLGMAVLVEMVGQQGVSTGVRYIMKKLEAFLEEAVEVEKVMEQWAVQVK